MKIKKSKTLSTKESDEMRLRKTAVIKLIIENIETMSQNFLLISFPLENEK